MDRNILNFFNDIVSGGPPVTELLDAYETAHLLADRDTRRALDEKLVDACIDEVRQVGQADLAENVQTGIYRVKMIFQEIMEAVDEAEPLARLAGALEREAFNVGGIAGLADPEGDPGAVDFGAAMGQAAVNFTQAGLHIRQKLAAGPAMVS